MICEPCGQAGNANARARRLLPDGAMRARYEALAVRRHLECVGGTRCDCQHKTGRHIGGQTEEGG